MKTHIIRLEKNDDLISIRDKMSWSKVNRVVLVWSENLDLPLQLLDIKLILRQSQKMSVQIAFVTHDRKIRELAGILGICVYDRIDQAERSHWRRKRPKIKNLQRMREPVCLNSRPGSRPFTQQDPKSFFWKFSFLSLGLVSVLSLFIFLLPAATVQLQPMRSKQQLELLVQAVPGTTSITLSGRIPLYKDEVILEKSIDEISSGQVEFPDHHATGEVVFTNLSSDMINIPENTIIRTTTEPIVRFSTLESVILEPEIDAQTKVLVEAVLPGTSGNIPELAVLAMEFENGQKISVTNLTPMDGGTDRFVLSPTESEVAAARNELMERMDGLALEEFYGNLLTGQKLIESSIQLEETLAEIIDPGVGQPADMFRITIRCRYVIWYYLEQDLQQLANMAIGAVVVDGYQVENAAISISPVQPPEWNGNEAAWNVVVERNIVQNLDTQGISNAIVGKTINEAKNLIMEQLALENEPVIQAFPAWWPRLPFLPLRIHFKAR